MTKAKGQPNSLEGEVLEGEEMPLAVRQRPISIQDGIGLLSVQEQNTALAERDERWRNILNWINSHMKEGIHYGFPPGCEPKYDEHGRLKAKRRDGSWYVVDEKQWQPKKMLYKAGALLLMDLFRLQVKYEPDKVGWEQLGSKAGTFVIKAVIMNPATQEALGEGRGVCAVSEKTPANTAIKMAEKSALSDAIINTVPLCAELFYPENDNPKVPPAVQPDKNNAAPSARTRTERKSVNGDGEITAAVTGPLFAAWRKRCEEDFDQRMEDQDAATKFRAYLADKAGRPVKALADWTPELAKTITDDLGLNDEL